MGRHGARTAAFTIEQARCFGLSKDRTYRRLESGELERVGRGVYVETGVVDPALTALVAATAVNPKATLCLGSALVWHGLSDSIPSHSDIALPRGTRHPAGFSTVSWRSFDPDTFDVGRITVQPDVAPDAAHPDRPLTAWGESLGVYSVERTIVDGFRMAHLEGTDAAVTALRRWLALPGHSPSSLLLIAESFPSARPQLRAALQILL